jgi:putative transposase
MARKLRSSAHSKHLIMYHIIFVPKYRRKIFANKKFADDLKEEMMVISQNYDFEIESIEIDPAKPDHLHLLIRSIPKLSPAMIVRVLKQETTIWAWMHYEKYLKVFYWKDHLLFTRGYFCGSVGNISADQVEAYLEAQSQNDEEDEETNDD